jgi:hypothetical protein
LQQQDAEASVESDPTGSAAENTDRAKTKATTQFPEAREATSQPERRNAKMRLNRNIQELCFNETP